MGFNDTLQFPNINSKGKQENSFDAFYKNESFGCDTALTIIN